MPHNATGYARRAVNRVSTWRPSRPGRQPLDVRRLVSPLRYDVKVRADFFVLLRTHAEPVAQLIERSRHHPYFSWFKHVECARYFPDLLADANALDKAFSARVTRGMATLTSYDQRGFDTKQPVMLLATHGTTASDSGAPTSAPLHIGDGCHRLALRMLDGNRLDAGMYRIRSARRPLFDNTALLLRHIEIPDLEYARFLSYGFLDEACADLSELRSRVASSQPHRISELEQVLAVHLKL